MLSEASDQQHVGCVESGTESSDSSDTETSSDEDEDDDDDDDGDDSSSSSDSYVTVSSTELHCVDSRSSISDDGKSHPPLMAEHSSLVIENSSAAAAAAAEPAVSVCQQLSSLTVSDEHHVTPSVSPVPQSHDNAPLQQ